MRRDAVGLQPRIVGLEPIKCSRFSENLAWLELHVIQHVLEGRPGGLVIDGSGHGVRALKGDVLAAYIAGQSAAPW